MEPQMLSSGVSGCMKNSTRKLRSNCFHFIWMALWDALSKTMKSEHCSIASHYVWREIVMLPLHTYQRLSVFKWCLFPSFSPTECIFYIRQKENDLSFNPENPLGGTSGRQLANVFVKLHGTNCHAYIIHWNWKEFLIPNATIYRPPVIHFVGAK